MDARQRRWLQSQIRRQYARMPGEKPSQKAWLEARVGYGQYKCAHCQDIFGPTEVHKDHVEPIIDVTGETDWNDWMRRLDGPIQILCIPCHKIKSKIENSTRARIRRQRKKDGNP